MYHPENAHFKNHEKEDIGMHKKIQTVKVK